MKLQNPSAAYSPRAELERNRQIEGADRQNHKRGRDVEIGASRLVLTSPNGTRYFVTVANDGTLGTTAL